MWSHERVHFDSRAVRWNAPAPVNDVWTFLTVHSADEWQAIFAGLTFLVATAAAWVALVQLRHNSRNQLELSRPVIVVDFHFRSNSISIAVANTGTTAARDLKLNWSDVPHIKDVPRKHAFEKNLVHGKVPFLAPGRVIRYRVGLFSAYPKDAVRTFIVDATYLGPVGKKRWSNRSVLDLDQWANAMADSDYDNKNWNEFRWQKEAQQKSARSLADISTALEILADAAMVDPRVAEYQKSKWDEAERAMEEADAAHAQFLADESARKATTTDLPKGGESPSKGGESPSH